MEDVKRASSELTAGERLPIDGRPDRIATRRNARSVVRRPARRSGVFFALSLSVLRIGCTSGGSGVEDDPPTVVPTDVGPPSSITSPTERLTEPATQPRSAKVSPLTTPTTAVAPQTGEASSETVPRKTSSPSNSTRSLSSKPTKVLVSALGIDSGVRRLGLTRDGRVTVPTDPQEIGWYRARGPLVLIGHVDSKTGPAIFYRLRELKIGSRIDLRMSDGHTRTYEVEEVIAVKKTEFPTARVYGSGESVGTKPDLRLVTCGGSFDRSIGHYRSNIIVFARLVHMPGA